MEQIIIAILAAAPSLVATIVVTIVGIIMKKFTNKKIGEAIEHVEMATAAIKSSKEYEEVKDQLALAHQENVELKRKLNKLLTKIDKVQRID